MLGAVQDDQPCSGSSGRRFARVVASRPRLQLNLAGSISSQHSAPAHAAGIGSRRPWTAAECDETAGGSASGKAEVVARRWPRYSSTVDGVQWNAMSPEAIVSRQTTCIRGWGGGGAKRRGVDGVVPPLEFGRTSPTGVLADGAGPPPYQEDELGAVPAPSRLPRAPVLATRRGIGTKGAHGLRDIRRLSPPLESVFPGGPSGSF